MSIFDEFRGIYRSFVVPHGYSVHFKTCEVFYVFFVVVYNVAPGPQTALIGGRNMPVFLAFKIVNKRSKLENVLYRCVGAPGDKIVNKCTGGIKNSTVVKAAYNYFVL